MKPKKPECRWPNAHVSLKRLYEERAPTGMSQEEFGAQYGIGTQPMVWQYLNGWRPLNIEAAAKFAHGLRCTIHEISPEMAAALEQDIVPMLGMKTLKRVTAKAMLLVTAALFSLPPTPAQADVFYTVRNAGYYVKSWWRYFRTFSSKFGLCDT